MMLQVLHYRQSRPMPFFIRPTTPTDTPALWEMLTNAARMPDDVVANIAGHSGRSLSEKYVEGWGKPGGHSFGGDASGNGENE